jgi:hypothetical protein
MLSVSTLLELLKLVERSFHHAVHSVHSARMVEICVFNGRERLGLGQFGGASV